MQRYFNLCGNSTWMLQSTFTKPRKPEGSPHIISDQGIQGRNPHLEQEGESAPKLWKPVLVAESSFQQLIKQYHQFSWQTPNQFNFFCEYPLPEWTFPFGLTPAGAATRWFRDASRGTSEKSHLEIWVTFFFDIPGGTRASRREKSRLHMAVVKDVRYSSVSILIKTFRERNRDRPKILTGKALTPWIK